MPASLSKTRLRKAFVEGRRSAVVENAENPYDNVKLRKLWELGRAQEQAGEIKTPIPRLVHGETRAQRSPQNPPGTKLAARRPARPRGGPGGGGGFGSGGFGGRGPVGRGDGGRGPGSGNSGFGSGGRGPGPVGR